MNIKEPDGVASTIGLGGKSTNRLNLKGVIRQMNDNMPAQRCQVAIDTDPIRFMKAQTLVNTNSAELVSDEGNQRIYTVVSQSNPNTKYKVYRSDYDAICTCHNSVRNHIQCKHIVAVLMIDPIKYDTIDSSWSWEGIRLTSDMSDYLDWLHLFSDMVIPHKPKPMSKQERIRFTSNRHHLIKEADMGKPSFYKEGTHDAYLWYGGRNCDAFVVFGGQWTNTNSRVDCRQMRINVYYDRKSEQWCICSRRNGFCTTAEFDDVKDLVSIYQDEPKNAMVKHFINGMKLFCIAMDTHKELFGDYPTPVFNNLLFHESSVYFQRDAGTSDEFAIDVSISNEDDKSIVIQHTLQTQEVM